MLLLFGGFFVVGASNIYNQIIEKDLDALMVRTKNRPLPTNRVSVNLALILAIIFTIIGLNSFLEKKYLHWRAFLVWRVSHLCVL